MLDTSLVKNIFLVFRKHVFLDSISGKPSWLLLYKLKKLETMGYRFKTLYRFLKYIQYLEDLLFVFYACLIQILIFWSKSTIILCLKIVICKFSLNHRILKWGFCNLIDFCINNVYKLFTMNHQYFYFYCSF